MNIQKLVLLATISACFATLSANVVDITDTATQEIEILTKVRNNEIELGSTVTYKEHDYVLSEISAYDLLTAATLVKPVMLLGHKIAEDIIFINLEYAPTDANAAIESTEYKASVSHQRRYTIPYYELKDIVAGASVMGVTLILGQGLLSVLGKKIEVEREYLMKK